MIDLRELLSIQTYSGAEWRMFAYIVRQCKRLDAHIRQDDYGNLYITKGRSNTYPCVVAHMDSVHKIGDSLSVIEHDDMLTGFNYTTMKQSGIGGDDKVGIYIALRCLEDFEHIKLAFFVDEERGCIGSGSADMSFFDDCRFVLQADRRGNSDFVVNASGVKLSSKKFKKDIKPLIQGFGYSFSDGMMTDVMQLKENGLKVSCANVSCGYYRPHSADEYVVISDVENCLDMFECIIEFMDEVYEHSYTRPVYYERYKIEGNDLKWSNTPTSHTKYTAYWDELDKGSDWRRRDITESAAAYCDGCSELCKENELAYTHDYNSYLCEKCVSILA